MIEIFMPEAIRRIVDSRDRELAWTFFVFFSRTEYALKRSGRYLKAGVKEAEPNWDRFASDHNDNFQADSSPELKTATQYFLDNPPLKQIRADGGMAWSEPQKYDENESLLIWLLRMIRCVRNNLFHGGKFPIVRISDPSRDRNVLLNSLVILRAILPLNSDVERRFFEGLDEVGLDKRPDEQLP